MPVDPLEYRQIFGGFATGVTVVTASHAGVSYGMTANSVTSLSLEPCLLLVCFIRGSQTLIAVKEAGWFGVNILHADQEDISNTFARTTGTFDEVAHTVDPHGVPILDGSLGHIVCRLSSVTDGGDHEIVVGEVVDTGPSTRADTDDSPLLFFRGKYRSMETR
ncbi:MAG: flavin reductase family protein [Acidimicrobiia bacterium]|nr:flavin reductase family protein [Acidimicrobiia bacterium]